jgi:hypothetical protein
LLKIFHRQKNIEKFETGQLNLTKKINAGEAFETPGRFLMIFHRFY